MLVFGRLERRKFQIPSIKNNAKDDAAGVIYIPLVCVGRSFAHAHFADVIHASWVSLCLSILNWFPTTSNDGQDKGSDTRVFCL